MKLITITQDEAVALLRALRSTWVPPDDQKAIYNLINRIERELGIE